MALRAAHAVAIIVMMAVGGAAAAPDPALELLWPMPASVTHGSDPVVLTTFGDFVFRATGVSSPMLTRAMTRVAKTVFQTHIPPPTTGGWRRPSQRAPLVATDDTPLLVCVNVTVTSTNQTLGMDTDESYELNVSAPCGTIEATTVFGAMHALQTFSQLVVAGSASGSGLMVPNTPWAIKDKPHWQHRGLLVDSSRHFLPLQSLYDTIDALAYSRMNVLHWHIVDSQSFPFESTTFPNLSRAGAYNDASVYSHADVQAVVAYALDRGVRVLVEFDTPAHTYAWGIGYQSEGLTMCGAAEPWTHFCAEPPCGQLDPSNEFTYKLVGGLWAEVAPLFADEFVHIGGDEVNGACWGVNSTGAAALMAKYVSRLQPLVAATGKGMIQWQGAFDVGVMPSKDTVIQLWKPASFRNVLAAGYRMLLSPYTSWYLDCGGGNWISGGTSWCAPFKSWQDVWSYKMAPDSGPPLTPAEEALIIGGEVALWGEMVDQTVVLQRAWPRAAAAGERMWTNPDSTVTWQDVLPRLRVHRARLVARGIPAEPLQPTYCSEGVGNENCPYPA